MRDEALRQIHKIANAPLNSIFKNQLGMGIVGGRLYEDDLEAKGSAQVAVRILRGEPASNFPPRVVPPSQTPVRTGVSCSAGASARTACHRVARCCFANQLFGERYW
jgi:hypothetical protein